jgi:BirA family biotin operon repressor/biotin-[acetyl-CoA-carboxylase] ligase
VIGRLAAVRRALGPAPDQPPLPWRLRALPVCASTERELDRWLAQPSPAWLDADGERLRVPLAVLARRQRFGHGRHGRAWWSPAGGVWLSAALPWPADPAVAAAPTLAVAVGLARQLEGLGLPVRIKRPNDLLLQGADGSWRKLAGILPGLRHRAGAIRWARAGVGINCRNPVPSGATNLVPFLGPSRAQPLELAARLLAALEWAMAWAHRPETIREEARRRLVDLPETVSPRFP